MDDYSNLSIGVQPTLKTAQLSRSRLGEEQLSFFKKNGYVALPEVTSAEEIVELRQIIGDLFRRKAGHEQGAYFNFAAGAEEDPNAPNIPQIVAPQNFDARLKKTEFRRNAAALARQLLGPEARFHIDHTLCKPAVDGAATPWHQDEAFRDGNFEFTEVSFWMPLQPVDEINGCMEFIPGSQEWGILPHRTPNNDPRIHALECYEGFDPADAVANPLPAGGCTIHGGRTLHGAGPNHSHAPRYAYVLIFRIPPVPAKNPQPFPWMRNRNTSRMQRINQWMKGKGTYVKYWRLLRDTELRDYKYKFPKLKARLLAKLGR